MAIQFFSAPDQRAKRAGTRQVIEDTVAWGIAGRGRVLQPVVDQGDKVAPRRIVQFQNGVGQPFVQEPYPPAVGPRRRRADHSDNRFRRDVLKQGFEHRQINAFVFECKGQLPL